MSGFEDLGYGKVDIDREQRTGFPEVIYGAGKTAPQIAGIAGRLLAHHGRALVTRVSPELAAELRPLLPEMVYHEVPRLVSCGIVQRRFPGTVAVLCAGTSDLPVAEEAAVTAEWLGCEVDRIYDVGVAGIDRLLAHRERIGEANVVIVVAGMEGALPSVVGGLVRRPVVAVPTSVGYGANLQGLTPMLTMMTSCAAGIAVMNIDNGFGAGYYASTIQQLVKEASD
ncbi:nickel pincer cofactor biosynthesis protein LarB [Paenibacillus sp. IB182496]|uniref:Nickel pincer cofactor biosynthesis protein LarB n=1 Tax=Paenibacillus sabuli TaxID=2772509 RepID=A0A927GR70_9BACL|nr:nickel pincer cofactor biosynthesis protein LarB [Paenibacillus sabuli]MBD2844996.1 nickel pincer cofactor biosynthesis protein LarB [Paenibacillus sabuli]